MKHLSCLVMVACVCFVPSAWAEEPVDLQVITRIKAEGLRHSAVMDTAGDIVDRHGSRLTGSPGIKAAGEWCRDKLTEWGLKDARLDPWGPFCRGWVLDRYSVEMLEPYYVNMIAYPKAWTPSTDGVISGTPILVDAESVEEIEAYKGKLKGAIVVTPLARELEPGFEPDAKRYSDEKLAELAKARTPGARRDRSRWREYRERRELRRSMNKVFLEEGAAAILEASRGQHGTLFVGNGGSRKADADPTLPALVVGVEHYGQVVRLLEKEVPVKLAVNLQTRFLEGAEAFNVLADIPGTDPELRGEIVLLGGHLDAYHAATGATDNAAGCAVAMEAVRILKAIDVQPRRTIRIALWGGEEQGFLGSRAYVKQYLADRETMELKDGHALFSAYYNFDNGTGRIRGIYCQGNDAVRPIFQAWLEPFHDLDATTVTLRNTGGTDHQPFDAVGLPGFQFIQDSIEYGTRTHHTNMDTYERLQRGDLMQASVIMASFVYHTAMRDERLPRKALPEPREERDRSGSGRSRG